MTKADFALHDFANIGEHSISNSARILLGEQDPILIKAKNIGNRCTCDYFHRMSNQIQLHKIGEVVLAPSIRYGLKNG